jgi:hypothetical protein
MDQQLFPKTVHGIHKLLPASNLVSVGKEPPLGSSVIEGESDELAGKL